MQSPKLAGRTLASMRASSSNARPETTRSRLSAALLGSGMYRSSAAARRARALLHRRASQNLKRVAQQGFEIGAARPARFFDGLLDRPLVVAEIHQRGRD